MKILLDSANCIDIFGLCETFLNETVDDEVLSMPGYTFEHKDLESQEIESVWIEIALRNNKPFLLCSVYRPPSSHAEWCELFLKQIERASGDINIDIKDGNISNTTWKHVRRATRFATTYY